MAASTRRLILDAIRERLRTITAGGLDENDVFLGEAPDLGPDDPDVAIAIVPGEDVVRRQGKKFLITWPIELQALAKADLAEPHVTAEDLLADIKRAFEVSDVTLGGLVTSDSIQRQPTRILPREAGLTTVGVGVTYTVDYEEGWGAP